MDAAEERCVVDSVEGLGEVHCHRHCPQRGTGLVEPRGYLMSQWQERSGGGASCPEAMLGVRELEVGGDEAELEPLQYLGSWAEERDRLVRGPLFLWFAWFEKRHYNGMLPYIWDAGVGEG